MIHETAEVSPQAKLGKDVKVWHYVQIREGARIGDGSSFGKAAYVDKNVVIGKNAKVQNRATIYDGATIGDNVFIGPHVVFTNDRTPRAFGDWKIVKTSVDDGASIGANSTIICGIKLGKYCMIGAGSVVTKDVGDHELVYGNPAKFKGYVCFCGEKLEGKMGKLKCHKCGKEVVIQKKVK